LGAGDNGLTLSTQLTVLPQGLSDLQTLKVDLIGQLNGLELGLQYLRGQLTITALRQQLLEAREKYDQEAIARSLKFREKAKLSAESVMRGSDGTAEAGSAAEIIERDKLEREEVLWSKLLELGFGSEQELAFEQQQCRHYEQQRADSSVQRCNYHSFMLHLTQAFLTRFITELDRQLVSV
jgi:hypothetical protein